jgi:hypothetical protein
MTRHLNSLLSNQNAGMSKMRFFVAVTTLGFVCAFSALEVLAQTADTRSIESHDTLEQQIRTWIEMLDSPRYRDRATASTNLQNLGAAAIETLERVASEGGSEASERAIEILKRHFHGPDGVLKAKASEALERIAAQTDLSKSKVAEKILTPAQEPQAVPMIPQLPIFQMPANQRITVRVTIRDGDKDIQIEENGKSIRVRENQKDGIQVERKDANGNIEKKSFKDETELKEKDPEAHRAYERGNGGGIKLEFNGRAQGMPNAPDGFPGDPPNLDEIRKQHEALHQQHLERIRQLREGRGIEQPLKPVDPEPAPEPAAEPKIIDALEV